MDVETKTCSRGLMAELALRVRGLGFESHRLHLERKPTEPSHGYVSIS